jgi:hypothetical protein
LTDFVSDLITLIIFTGCGKKNDARRSKTSNPSLTSMFIESENVPGLALTLSAKSKISGNVPHIETFELTFLKISSL